MVIKGKTVVGVVAQRPDGKFWGIVYSDGHGTSYGFTDIDHAEISNPDFCHRPTDMTNENNTYDVNQLRTATLKEITKETTFTVESIRPTTCCFRDANDPNLADTCTMKNCRVKACKLRDNAKKKAGPDVRYDSDGVDVFEITGSVSVNKTMPLRKQIEAFHILFKEKVQ